MKKPISLILAAVMILSCLGSLCLVDALADTNSSADKAFDDVVMPSDVFDFTTADIQGTFANTSGMTATCKEGEYTTFLATNGDPYTWIRTPKCKPLQARYANIYFRTDCAQKGELFCTRSDNGIMGSQGTNVQWDWNATGDWETMIVECYAWLDCDENIVFDIFRIDPLQGSDIQGKSIDIKYIAFFATEEEAAAFQYDRYLEKLAYEQEIKRQEEESRKQAEEEAKKNAWPEPTFKEMTTQPYDTEKGSLKYTVSEDGQTVTISYVVNGETRSYTVPNRQNYLFGGYAGTDDLDRSLYTSEEVGSYNPAEKDRYVGLFYFLWHGEHGDSGVFDLQKIIDTLGVSLAGSVSKSQAYGPVGAMHWFAEPLYGYYYANDAWVMRKHAELLTNANIDFLYFDVTNGYYYLNNALQIMKFCHELNEQGYDAPQVVFYTHSNSGSVVRGLYNDIYSKGLYEDTWFMIDGKPVIIAPYEDNINDFFTIKREQWPNEATRNANGWPWMDFDWPARIFPGLDADGNPDGRDAISVSVAQHCGNTAFSTSALYKYQQNRGRSFFVDSSLSENPQRAYQQSLRSAWKKASEDPTVTYHGFNFQAQWDHAIESGATYILVTGWNEWVAQRQPNDSDQAIFMDTGSMEYSRDTEMMRGGYFDNYYMQLIYNVQKLKGTAPMVVQDSRKPINVTGTFDQWDDVLVTYTDGQGDTMNRDAIGFGRTPYTDASGRNDIIASKVTNDSTNLYFYVKTADSITKYDNQTSWMQLYLDIDSSTKTGWYGYDFLINREVKDAFTTTIAKYQDGQWVTVGEASYQVQGNQMMIALPLATLGATDYRELNVQFKWADSLVPYESMENMYEYGDVAPLGRLNYVYQNYIPGVSVVEYPERVTEPETDEPTEPTVPATEPATDPITTPVEESTPAPITEAITDNTSDGCASMVGSAACLALIAMLSGAGILLRKKHR